MEEIKVKRFTDAKNIVVESVPDKITLHDNFYQLEWDVVLEVDDEILGKAEKHFKGNTRILKNKIIAVEVAHNKIQQTYDVTTVTLSETANYNICFKTYEEACAVADKIWNWINT